MIESPEVRLELIPVAIARFDRYWDSGTVSIYESIL
jgi:hypothetical protein